MNIPLRTVAEFVLESHVDRDNPYLDVDVVAVFTGPGGISLRRPAFWDGGRVWRIRFAPTEVGGWSWRTEASDADDAGLHGVVGSLEATGLPAHATPAQQHGFLRPSDDGTHMAFADGSPFFWLGDTHWRFTWEEWNHSNKPGWPSQFRGMVDKRVDQGFTVYQTNLMSFGRGWDTDTFWESGEPYRRMVPSYFSETVDPRMAYIAQRGLINAFGIGWYQAIDGFEAELARFARYLVARYGALPIVWTLGGETGGYDAHLRGSRIDGWRGVALAIADADDYCHPITAHLTNERPIAPYYQNEEWLSLTLNQLGHGDLDMSPRAYRDHLHTHPGRPLVEGESMYEGITTQEPVQRRIATATVIRQVAYRAIQSGCCGYTYGAQGCWDNNWDEDSGGTMWGDLPWFDGIDLPGAEQLGHLRRFYESLPWSTLRPDDDTFTTTSGENELFFPPNVTSDPEKRNIVLFFGETHRDGGIETLTGLTAPRYRGRWFDPREGVWFEQFEMTSINGAIVLPAQPDAHLDWLLHVEAI